MTKKGNIEWAKAVIGDSAYVKSENKMGVIMKDYGRKFHLRFADDTEKTYDASELEFYRLDEDEFKDGGNIEKDNNEMIQNQIKEAAHHAKELGYIVNDKTPIEAWVVAKMERATSDLSDVTHYLDGEESKRLKKPVFENGGNVLLAEGDDFLHSNISEKWEELQQIRSDIKTFILLAVQVSGEELAFDVTNSIVLGIIDAIKKIKESGDSELAFDLTEILNRASNDVLE